MGMQRAAPSRPKRTLHSIVLRLKLRQSSLDAARCTRVVGTHCTSVCIPVLKRRVMQSRVVRCFLQKLVWWLLMFDLIPRAHVHLLFLARPSNSLVDWSSEGE